MAQLIVPMGTIVETNYKQVESFIFNGWWKSIQWHDCMCQGHTLVATLVAK